jgi:hypothetical protein
VAAHLGTGFGKISSVSTVFTGTRAGPPVSGRDEPSATRDRQRAQDPAVPLLDRRPDRPPRPGADRALPAGGPPVRGDRPGSLRAMSASPTTSRPSPARAGPSPSHRASPSPNCARANWRNGRGISWIRRRISRTDTPTRAALSFVRAIHRRFSRVPVSAVTAPVPGDRRASRTRRPAIPTRTGPAADHDDGTFVPESMT